MKYLEELADKIFAQFFDGLTGLEAKVLMTILQMRIDASMMVEAIKISKKYEESNDD